MYSSAQVFLHEALLSMKLAIWVLDSEGSDRICDATALVDSARSLCTQAMLRVLRMQAGRVSSLDALWTHVRMSLPTGMRSDVLLARHVQTMHTHAARLLADIALMSPESQAA